MDIDLLSKMVKELILDNDEVALPGVGVFVAEIVPSTFSDKGYTINPPYRRLYFRQRENEEGRALIDFYAKSNPLGKNDAERIIRDFLDEMKAVLKEKKTIVFPGLGRLRSTKENNFFFVADEDLDIYPYGFGLEPISLKNHVETREEVAAAVSGLKNLLNVRTEDPEAATETNVEAAAVTAATEVAENGTETAAETAAAETTAGTSTEATAEPATTAYETGNDGNHSKGILKAGIITIAAIATLLILFAIISRLFPGLTDSLLYNSEELEIIHHS